jgi:hypothetical protein
MKIFVNNREQGSALAVTLITCLLIGIVLASYMGLVSSRYKITIRSQCWNQAIPVAEQGIEEALAHLHDDSNAPAANNWTQGMISGQTVYSKQRTNNDGSYFLANLYYSGTNDPYIYGTGFVPTPLDPSTYISRMIRVTCTNPPTFSYGIAAIYDLRMNGNSSTFASDSYNSNDPLHSSNGQYVASMATTNGNVASVYGPVNLGNHTIAGNLSLGPSIDPSSVGPGQVTGQIYTDFNVSFPDAQLPPALTNAPQASVATNGPFAGSYVFGSSGAWSIPSSGGNTPIEVLAGASVQLRVDATSFNPTTVHIGATNGISGTLYLYQVSGSMALSGGVTVDSGCAQNFYYYGLPGVTSISMGGSSTFYGAIYAPEADMVLSGGGSGNNFCGALVAKTVTMSGHYDIHFDQALLQYGPKRGYVMASWREM